MRPLRAERSLYGSLPAFVTKEGPGPGSQSRRETPQMEASMRYGVAIPHANVFATPDAIRAMARAVEDLGFDSIWVSDHIIVPEGSSYIPEFMDEPLAILAFLASETRH